MSLFRIASPLAPPLARAIFPLLAVLAAFAGPAVAAQEEAPSGTFGQISGTETTAAPYYYFTERGAPTVRVELWGAIGAPGLYDLRAGTDLRTLLTIAGGPQFSDNPSVKQRIDIVIYRGPEGARTTLEVIDAANVPVGENPRLESGDTIYVRSVTKRSFNVRDGIAILASVLGIVLAADRLFGR